MSRRGSEGRRGRARASRQKKTKKRKERACPATREGSRARPHPRVPHFGVNGAFLTAGQERPASLRSPAIMTTAHPIVLTDGIVCTPPAAILCRHGLFCFPVAVDVDCPRRTYFFLPLTTPGKQPPMIGGRCAPRYYSCCEYYVASRRRLAASAVGCG